MVVTVAHSENLGPSLFSSVTFSSSTVILVDFLASLRYFFWMRVRLLMKSGSSSAQPYKSFFSIRARSSASSMSSVVSAIGPL